MLIALATASVTVWSNGAPFGLPSSRWEAFTKIIAQVSFGVSILFSFIGSLMGFTHRNLQVGKLAGISGGVLFVLWLLLLGLIVIQMRKG